MHVCTKSFLKTKTNSSCVCTHLANKADSDSDSDSDFNFKVNYPFKWQQLQIAANLIHVMCVVLRICGFLLFV